MKKDEREILCNLLGISEKSYYRWKKTDHKKIILLIEKYFTKEELKEFLETEKIERQDYFKNYSKEELEEYFKNINNQEILMQIEELKKGLI